MDSSPSSVEGRIVETLEPTPMEQAVFAQDRTVPPNAGGTVQGENWSRFSFCLSIIPFKARKSTSVVSSDSVALSMTRSELGPVREPVIRLTVC